jgi:hypothetical protein
MLPPCGIWLAEESDGSDDIEEESDVSEEAEGIAARGADVGGCMPDGVAMPANLPKSLLG